jgi:hypothetical protein
LDQVHKFLLVDRICATQGSRRYFAHQSNQSRQAAKQRIG